MFRFRLRIGWRRLIRRLLRSFMMILGLGREGLRRTRRKRRLRPRKPLVITSKVSHYQMLDSYRLIWPLMEQYMLGQRIVSTLNSVESMGQILERSKVYSRVRVLGKTLVL